MKSSLTQHSAVVLLPVSAGLTARFGTAPTTTCQQGTAVPFVARLRVAADVIGFGAVDAAPPPRGAPV